MSVYNQADLVSILNFLESRFLNYKNIYYNIDNKKYDYAMKAFVERLLVRELMEISTLVTTKYPNINTDNMLILNSTSEEDIEDFRSKILDIVPDEEEANGIISWTDKVASYKHKRDEEIYIEDAKGNIKEISELASTNIYAKNVLNLKENINGLLVIVPVLAENHEKDVLSIKETIEEFNQKYEIKNDTIKE